jgi:hypothetical protein
MNTQWVFIFPFANILFSLLVAGILGTKKHIGFVYSFLWCIGFTFIVGWIITGMATPLNEPYKKTKKDIYTWVLVFIMAVLVVGSVDRILKAVKVLDYGSDLFSYGVADAKRTIWQSVFFIIGGLTTIRYIFDPFLPKEIKEAEPVISIVEKPKPFEPEVPNYEIAERESKKKRD